MLVPSGVWFKSIGEAGEYSPALLQYGRSGRFPEWGRNEIDPKGALVS
ncbi:MAG: hypothetical protein WA633_18180 [Stellaceae bacterium]